MGTKGPTVYPSVLLRVLGYKFEETAWARRWWVVAPSTPSTVRASGQHQIVDRIAVVSNVQSPLSFPQSPAAMSSGQFLSSTLEGIREECRPCKLVVRILDCDAEVVQQSDQSFHSYRLKSLVTNKLDGADDTLGRRRCCLRDWMLV